MTHVFGGTLNLTQLQLWSCVLSDHLRSRAEDITKRSLINDEVAEQAKVFFSS